MQGIHQRGWCDGTGGNFSVVQQRHPLQLLMAPSGVDKGEVQADQLIVVDGDGKVVNGEGKASAETALHLRIVEANNAGAVLHTHSVPGTVLSLHFEQKGVIVLAGWEMLKGLDGINTQATSINIPVISNSQSMQELGDAIAPCLASARAVSRSRAWPLRVGLTWRQQTHGFLSFSECEIDPNAIEIKHEPTTSFTRHRGDDMSSEFCQRGFVPLRNAGTEQLHQTALE